MTDKLARAFELIPPGRYSAVLRTLHINQDSGTGSLEFEIIEGPYLGSLVFLGIGLGSPRLEAALDIRHREKQCGGLRSITLDVAGVAIGSLREKEDE